MNTITGLSFYDSLNKMTIGILILLLIFPIPNSIEGKFLYVVAAFIVGSMFQMIVQQITGNSGFWGKIKKPIEKDKSKYRCLFNLCARLNLTNNSKLIRKAYNDLHKKSYNESDMEMQYYKAYYNVARNGILMNIPILEALENFMRNMMVYCSFPLLLKMVSCTQLLEMSSCLKIVVAVFLCGVLIATLPCDNFVATLLCGISLLLILLDAIVVLENLFGTLPRITWHNFILSIVTKNPCYRLVLYFVCALWWMRREIQYKIHYLIWEGDYYIRRLDKERNKA